MVVPEPVGRLHVLVIDRVVVLDKGQRRLVVKVLALAAHSLMRFRQQLHGFATASAPFFAP
jgi:hypothetical protein